MLEALLYFSLNMGDDIFTALFFYCQRLYLSVALKAIMLYIWPVKLCIKLIISKKNRVNEFLGYAFLILFIGYYGSITLFYHSHLILGDTIVHSHPYKSDSNGNPVHSHTEKGYLTIQFLSFFSAFSLLIIYTFRIKAPCIYELITLTAVGAESKSKHYFYPLRAPPSLMII